MTSQKTHRESRKSEENINMKNGLWFYWPYDCMVHKTNWNYQYNENHFNYLVSNRP